MNFSEFKDIYDFYRKTGMTSIQTFEFLKNELMKNVKEGSK